MITTTNKELYPRKVYRLFIVELLNINLPHSIRALFHHRQILTYSDTNHHLKPCRHLRYLFKIEITHARLLCVGYCRIKYRI